MRRKWLVPVVAVALALVTTLAIIGYLQGLRQQAAAMPAVRMAAVVFAKANIAERRVVPASALELRQVPESAVHPDAARRVEDVADKVAIAPIFADEQVLLSKLAPTGVKVGLSYVLPKDKRAMTIAVNEVVGVAGFVFPGDRVDVVGTVRLNDELSFTKMILQDVEVLAIAQKVEQKQGEDPRVTTSATLALTPEQTETLAQIDNNGKVRLALRPYGVEDRVQTTGKTVDAALGRVVARAAAAAQPAAPAKPAAPRATTRARLTAKTVPPPPPLPTASTYSVELWRSTAKSTVQVEEGRK